MRVRNMVGAVLLAAVVATGCGSDGDSTAADGGSSGGSGASWCVDGAKIGEKFDTLDLDPSAKPADLKTAFSTVAKDVKTLADKAPSEIKADVKLVADAIGTLNTTLAKYDYDFVKVAADPSAIKSFEAMGDAKFEAASERVETWIQKNCPAAAK
jgi:hypothetical protein